MSPEDGLEHAIRQLDGVVSCQLTDTEAVVMLFDDERLLHQGARRNCRWRHRLRPALGRLLVSRIVAGNDCARALTGILTSRSRGSGRRSSGEFSSTRRGMIN